MNSARASGHGALPNTRANQPCEPPFHQTNFSGNQKRFMSSTDGPRDASFDETMDKLFQKVQSDVSGEGDAWFLEEAGQAAWDPKKCNPCSRVGKILSTVKSYKVLLAWVAIENLEINSF